MAEHAVPHWQPLSFLPKLAEMVDGMLESAAEVYHSLQQLHRVLTACLALTEVLKEGTIEK